MTSISQNCQNQKLKIKSQFKNAKKFEKLKIDKF